MNLKINITILSICTWFGMVALTILGWLTSVPEAGQPQQEPFNPTNWMLFGMVTGFAVGAMFLRTSHQIVSYPHRGEDEKCQWCYYSSREGAVCHCPDCVGDAYGPDYRTKVYAHGKIPLHNNEVEEAKCRVCKNRGWT